MTRIELQIHDDVLTTINKIKNLDDVGIELVIPEGSVLFENVLNLKLLDEFAEKNQLSLQFTTNDENGNILLEMLKDNGGNGSAFISEESRPEIIHQERPKKVFNFKLPHLSLSLPNLPIKGGLIIGIVIAGILGGAAFILIKMPKATANIVVDTQQLTRSVTIKVTSTGTTNADEKTLRGTTVTTTAEETDVIDTTGTTVTGTYAQGEVKIYNATSSDKKFKKGTTLSYKKDDTIYKYTTDDDVEVPALDKSTDTVSSKTVDITATEYGDGYNIDSGKEMTIKDQDESDFWAKTSKKLKGGKKETAKAVAAVDQTTLLQNVTDKTKNSAAKSLQQQIGSGQKLIDESIEETITKTEYSHQVGDKTDTLNLTLGVNAQGLTYNTGELNKLLDQLIKDLVPDGYKLSDENRKTDVQVLGNASSSVLNSKEADIQVTLKASIVPDIDVDQIKNDLRGKSVGDAQKILGSIKNIKTYDFKIEPSLPLLKRVPNDLTRIKVTILNE